MTPLQLVQLHRREFDAIVNRLTEKQFRQLYSISAAVLIKRLRRALKKGQPFGAYGAMVLLEQVRDVLSLLGARVETELIRVAQGLAKQGFREVGIEIKALTRQYEGFTPLLAIEEAQIQSGLVDGVHKSILGRIKSDESRPMKTIWEADVIDRVEKEMAISTLTNRDTDETIASVAGIIRDEEWKAERIVRTESAYAYGTARQRAMEESEKERPGLKRVWVEHFDHRTGDDSYVMHGQVVGVSEPFIWKRRRKTSWDTVHVMSSPNRPNDRSTVLPHRDDWKVAKVHRALTNAELSARGIAIPPGRKDDGSYTTVEMLAPV